MNISSIPMILNFMVSVSPPPTDIFIFQAAGSYIDARLFHQKLTHMFDIVAFSELFSTLPYSSEMQRGQSNNHSQGKG